VALAERAWRPLLGLAVTAFVVCGPAHALGQVNLVYSLVLVGLASSVVAIPLGLLGLRDHAAPTEAGAAGAPDAAGRVSGWERFD
jgi:hypothetical protein